MELPPRARRIRNRTAHSLIGRGTTSACAENTAVTDRVAVNFRNYLRVRGEYAAQRLLIAHNPELPPRARRIPPRPKQKIERNGTTSACAENTPPLRSNSTAAWNYLRVRGEYLSPPPGRPLSRELPPRARRILAYGIESVADFGTTSACAENTGRKHARTVAVWNYLRVRGEYLALGHTIRSSTELPPRARRIRNRDLIGSPYSGTTSACAENTLRCQRSPVLPGNYLRVRGEYPK